MDGISPNTKLEIAVEIIAAQIAQYSNKGYTINDKKMKELLEERNQMYYGNEQIIDKIIREYGPEIKNNYKKGEI